MDFLSIVQRLGREAGATNSGPATVVSQTGEFKRLVDWASTAWMNLQQESDDWHWMRGDFSYNLVAGDPTFTYTDAGLTAFGRWWEKTLRCYTTSVGVSDEQKLSYKPWDEFRDTFELGTPPTATRPRCFTVRPDGSITVGPTGDVDYTIRGEYQKGASPMALDADVPTGLPDDLHMLIVWDALVLYGTYEPAPEAVIRGNNYGVPLGFRLGRRKRNAIRLGAALA